MVERVFRIANGFEEADRLDALDVEAMTLEDRISGVERLRRARFGEGRPQPRLDRVLVCADRASRSLRARRRPRGSGSIAVLALPDKVFMLGRKPLRIDILTGIDGVSFSEVWKGRIEASFASAPLFVIGRAELLKNKRASGRKKDLLDVAMIEARAPSSAPKRR